MPRNDTLHRDQEVLRFIREYIREHEYPPTRGEISTFLGSRSATSADRSLDRLVADGLIERDPNVARGLRIKRTVAKIRTEEM